MNGKEKREKEKWAKEPRTEIEAGEKRKQYKCFAPFYCN